MIALAFLVVIFFTARETKKYNINPKDIWDLGFWTVISGILGARILYVILEWPSYKNNLLEIIMINHGGLIFYGGLLLSIPALFLYLKIKKINFFNVAKSVIVYLPLGHAIGRVGCFLNGCCHGKRTDSWLYSSQLYESAWNLFIFIFLLILRKKAKDQKILFYFYLLLYGIGRFVIEFTRGDAVTILGGLRISQWISILLIIVGLYGCGTRMTRMARINTDFN